MSVCIIVSAHELPPGGDMEYTGHMIITTSVYETLAAGIRSINTQPSSNSDTLIMFLRAVYNKELSHVLWTMASYTNIQVTTRKYCRSILAQTSYQRLMEAPDVNQILTAVNM